MVRENFAAHINSDDSGFILLALNVRDNVGKTEARVDQQATELFAVSLVVFVNTEVTRCNKTNSYIK